MINFMTNGVNQNIYKRILTGEIICTSDQGTDGLRLLDFGSFDWEPLTIIIKGPTPDIMPDPALGEYTYPRKYMAVYHKDFAERVWDSDLPPTNTRFKVLNITKNPEYASGNIATAGAVDVLKSNTTGKWTVVFRFVGAYDGDVLKWVIYG